MSSDNNIRPLNVKPDELAAAIEQLKRALPMLLENAALISQVKWTYFQALKKQGFNDVQALELCTRSMTL